MENTHSFVTPVKENIRKKYATTVIKFQKLVLMFSLKSSKEAQKDSYACHAI